MRSFALWYSLTDEHGNCNKEVKVHINLWGQDKAKGKGDNKEYCFDFGFLVEDISLIDNIFLYCPFKLTKEQIEDLGSTISRDNKLVNAIFNENFTTTDGEPKRLKVNGDSEHPEFIIYFLEVDSQIKLEECKRNAETPGTVLSIRINDIVCKGLKRYYFRIRIKVPNKDIRLINDQVKGISIFNNHFTNTEIIDFRLNDIRSCSEELREKFNKGEKFKITAIHYLILRDASDVIIHYGKEMSSRMLEDDLWRQYIGKLDCDIIAYHLKSKAKYGQNGNLIPLENFSALTRFQYQKETKTIIVQYIIGIIFLSVIGNALTALLVFIYEAIFAKS